MRKIKWLCMPVSLCMVFIMLFSLFVSPVLAEDESYYEDAEESYDYEADDDSDDEYIPEEYYDPIQSNEVELWPQGEPVEAAAAVVMDMDTGAFLYAKNIERQLYPASITKIMTCLLVLENCSLDETMTCSEVVYDLEENASNTGLQPGEEMTIRDALYTLMLQSANDTANALAEHVAGSISAFADLMNSKASSLGCTGTHFTNPSGLTDDNHYTTARDMALISQAAYANPDFRVFASTVEEAVGPTNMYEETRYLSNHHRMLQPDSDYYQEWCTGGKTGFTQAAWNTLVTFGEKGGRRYVCVLLHGNGADRNYRETTALMNYAFDNFEHRYMERELSGKTVSDLMHVNYLGKGDLLSAQELKQYPADIYDGYVTVPNGSDMELIKRRSSSGESPGVCSYYFNGWKVGNLYTVVHPVSFSLTIPWQVREDLVNEKDEEALDKQKQVEKTNEIVWGNIEEFVGNISDKTGSFVESNQNAVILSIGVIVIIVLLMLLVILLRSTREYRSRKKRLQAEKEAKRIEAEIEAKTTAEIEEELRAAMERSKRTDD